MSYARWGESSRTMSWQDRAACIKEDPELFYPDARDYQAITKAIALYRTCPVVSECAQKADDLERGSTTTREVWGIWGGETPIERAMRRGLLAKPPTDPNRYKYAPDQPCWGCDRLMRPKRARSDTPGIVRYEGQGLCSGCFKKLAVPRCSHCREMMRPPGTRPESFPIAKDPADNGLCQECAALRQPNGLFRCRGCKRILRTYGGRGYHIRCRPGQKKTNDASSQTVKTHKNTKKNTTTTKEPKETPDQEATPDYRSLYLDLKHKHEQLCNQISAIEKRLDKLPQDNNNTPLTNQ